jgi:hypothetical protein
MLRTDLFKTMDRVHTRFIATRDTITIPDTEFDVRILDVKHNRQGRLGVGVHFLILLNGDIQLGRRVNTIGSHSRDFDEISVAIGVVGGINEEGDRANTRTPEQLEALADLIALLQIMYPGAEPHDRPAQPNPSPMI